MIVATYNLEWIRIENAKKYHIPALAATIMTINGRGFVKDDDNDNDNVLLLLCMIMTL